MFKVSALELNQISPVAGAGGLPATTGIFNFAVSAKLTKPSLTSISITPPAEVISVPAASKTILVSSEPSVKLNSPEAGVILTFLAMFSFVINILFDYFVFNR